MREIFTWRAMYIFDSISGSTGAVSLNIHTWYFRRRINNIIRFIDVDFVHRRVGLYVHHVGNGMVKPYTIRRTYSRKVNRHTTVSYKVWASLRNNHLPCNCDESRKQTTWNVFVWVFKITKNTVNSASDQKVCARTALTNSSSNKQHCKEQL